MGDELAGFVTLGQVYFHQRKDKKAAEIFLRRFCFESFAYAFQIMSATVLPAGMNGSTCVEYGTTTSRT